MIYKTYFIYILYIPLYFIYLYLIEITIVSHQSFNFQSSICKHIVFVRWLVKWHIVLYSCNLVSALVPLYICHYVTSLKTRNVQVEVMIQGTPDDSAFRVFTYKKQDRC